MILRSLSSRLLGGLVVVVFAGCGGSGRDGFDQFSSETNGTPPTQQTTGSDQGSFGGGTQTPGVVLDPKNTTVIIDTATTPVTPGSVTFKMVAQGKDVTSGATFTLKDGTLGSFAGATFTSVASLPAGTLGKSTNVVAQAAEGQALGTLTVVQLRKTGAQRDFFFIVPYGGNPTPKNDILTFSTNIKQADVAFVMDTTGSMTTSINGLKTALQGTLLAQLQAAIPNVGIAIVDHKDVGDVWVASVKQTITTSLPLAQAAVGTMSASGGGDTPEAQIAAMEFSLTGAANSGGIAAHTPAAGTFGGVDFRGGSVPVVVEISDASWHDPSGSASMTTLEAAFTAHKAKFVNIHDTNYDTDESQANVLSDATSSNVPASAFAGAGCAAGQCCSGVGGVGRAPAGPGGNCRLNFLSLNGAGLSSGVVAAIKAIAVGTTFDVKAVASNNPKNPGGVDATRFIQALRAIDEGNAANGCPPAPATDTNGDGIKDTFTQLAAGTPVCFEIIPKKNDFVPPLLDPQFFNAFIDVIAVQGNLALDHRSVLFMVPPKDPGVQ